jgi:hypothetical protein
MWMVIDEKQQEASRKFMEEQNRRHAEEAKQKAEAREAHIKATTCPHCGRHDPVPPWLM